MHLRELGAQALQRLQPDRHLRRRGDQKDDREDRKRQRRVPAEVADIGINLAAVDRDREAERPVARAQPALEHEQLAARRPGQEVPVERARGQGIGRQIEREVPKRARADRLAGRVLDLPVETAVGLGEARVAERPGDLRLARPGQLEGGGQLVQVIDELALGAALDVLLEQQRQAEAGEHEGRHHRAGGGQQQTYAQGSARAHHEASRV